MLLKARVTAPAFPPRIPPPPLLTPPCAPGAGGWGPATGPTQGRPSSQGAPASADAASGEDRTFSRPQQQAAQRPSTVGSGGLQACQALRPSRPPAHACKEAAAVSSCMHAHLAHADVHSKRAPCGQHPAWPCCRPARQSGPPRTARRQLEAIGRGVGDRVVWMGGSREAHKSVVQGPEQRLHCKRAGALSTAWCTYGEQKQAVGALARVAGAVNCHFSGSAAACMPCKHCSAELICPAPTAGERHRTGQHRRLSGREKVSAWWMHPHAAARASAATAVCAALESGCTHRPRAGCRRLQGRPPLQPLPLPAAACVQPLHRRPSQPRAWRGGLPHPLHPPPPPLPPPPDRCHPPRCCPAVCSERRQEGRSSGRQAARAGTRHGAGPTACDPHNQPAGHPQHHAKCIVSAAVLSSSAAVPKQLDRR